MEITIEPARKIAGTITPPGDKSISHRSLIFGAIANGTTKINAILNSADVQSTKQCLQQLGIKIETQGSKILVYGNGLTGPKVPKEVLDCGNSGTSIRLLMGVLAGVKGESKLIGDDSLSSRPMDRVSTPLTKMGAQFELTNSKYLPLTIKGSSLKAIQYSLPVSSAQIKSAILLAALYADGTTVLSGKIKSRDHTEKMLRFFGVNCVEKDNCILIEGGQELQAKEIHVPSDPSSAAFWIAAGALLPDSKITVNNVLLNPTRIGFYKYLKLMGAKIEYKILQTEPEEVGNITVYSSNLKGVTIDPSDVSSLIDEIPILCILAAYASGTTKITGAKELRVKESDRIEAVAVNLKAMGANVETFEDGLTIEGKKELKGARIKSFHDHRIAMSFAIAALKAKGKTVIDGADCVSISYPDFFKTLNEVVHEN